MEVQILGSLDPVLFCSRTKLDSQKILKEKNP